MMRDLQKQRSLRILASTLEPDCRIGRAGAIICASRDGVRPTSSAPVHPLEVRLPSKQKVVQAEVAVSCSMTGTVLAFWNLHILKVTI